MSRKNTSAYRRTAAGSRPLKVGETVRHALSQILQRGEVYDIELARHNVTVTEVRMSPDLAHAHVFVVPLGGIGGEAMLAALKTCAPRIRTALAHAIKLRHVPQLHFQMDTSFDHADNIQRIMNDPAVARDIHQIRDEIARDMEEPRPDDGEDSAGNDQKTENDEGSSSKRDT